MELLKNEYVLKSKTEFKGGSYIELQDPNTGNIISYYLPRTYNRRNNKRKQK